MWAWIRTPRGSTTTALVVAVILALLWLDPWDRPLPGRLAPVGDPVMRASTGGAAPVPSPAAPVSRAAPVSPAAPVSLATPLSPAVSPPPAAGGSLASTAPDTHKPTGSPSAIAPAIAPTVATTSPPAASSVAPPPASPSGTAAPAPSPSATAAASAPSPGDGTPSFDVVRVEPDGSSVIAGRGDPGSEVVLLDGDKVVSHAPVDATGQFALLPPTLAPGDHTLALETRRADHAPVRSGQNVAVSLARAANTRPLVALLSPDKPAEILSDGSVASAPAVPAAPAGGGASSVPALSVPLAIQTVEARSAGQFIAAGVAKPGASSRVYLNGAFVAEVTAGPSGRWSVEVQKGMTPGRYLVRADQVEPANGKVLSRVEVPFDYPVGGTPDVRPSRVAQAGIPAHVRPTAASAGNAGSPLPAGPPKPGSAPDAAAVPPSGAGMPATSVASSKGAAGAIGSAFPKAAAKVAAGSAVTAADTGAPAAAPEPGSAPAPGSPATAGAGVKLPPRALNRDVASSDDGAPEGAASAIIADLRTATVSSGDSLWRISRKLLGRGMRYTEIYASNTAQIRNPALIYPGQVFVVPTQRVD